MNKKRLKKEVVIKYAEYEDTWSLNFRETVWFSFNAKDVEVIILYKHLTISIRKNGPSDVVFSIENDKGNPQKIFWSEEIIIDYLKYLYWSENDKKIERPALCLAAEGDIKLSKIWPLCSKLLKMKIDIIFKVAK